MEYWSGGVMGWDNGMLERWNDAGGGKRWKDVEEGGNPGIGIMEGWKTGMMAWTR